MLYGYAWAAGFRDGEMLCCKKAFYWHISNFTICGIMQSLYWTIGEVNLRARTLIILYHRGEGRGAGHCHFSVIDARVIYRFPHLTTKSALFYANLSFFCHRCKSHFQIYRSPHLTTKSAFFMQICHFSVIDARVIFRFAHLTSLLHRWHFIVSCDVTIVSFSFP
jgi:hypothetical protein